MIGVDTPASASASVPASETIPIPFPNMALRNRSARDLTTETQAGHEVSELTNSRLYSHLHGYRETIIFSERSRL
jgi:hypothetical protein